MTAWHDRLGALQATEGDGAAFTVLWNMLHARVFAASRRSPGRSRMGMLWDGLRGRASADARGPGYPALSTHEKTIWVANVLVAEVMNGGFHQFFSNTSGNHSDEVPDALRRVGATAMLDLFGQACRILRPDGRVPLDRGRRNKALDSIDPDEDRCHAAFDAVDQAFHALPGSAHPDLLRYALDHRDALDYSLQEVEAALEAEPYLLFPEDRRAAAHFDHAARIVHLELADGAHAFPLRDVSRMVIAKVLATPGSSGLVYRFETQHGVHDVPFFARGEGASGTVFWFFTDVMQRHPLVGFRNALAEARSRAPMEPIELWRNVPGARYLD